MHATIVESDPPLPTRRLDWPDEAACARSAQQLAPLLARSGDALIELCGPLAAGKTTFARHLLRALGVQGRVKSPSFALVETHEAAGLSIWHFDLYRLTQAREWTDAGFDELLALPGLKLIEWPENAAGALPVPDWRLHLEPDADDDTARHVRIEALSARGRQWLAAFAA